MTALLTGRGYSPMPQTRPLRVSLSEVSPTASKLSGPDALEMAAFGLLVDWEMGQFLDPVGWHLVRLSFTWREDEVLLVVKLLVQDLPYVAFVTRSSPIDCMRTFVRKVKASSLAMYPDKFS